VVRLLRSQGRPIRILTRDQHDTRALASPGVEIAVGNVQDTAAVGRALRGVDTVVSAIHGFAGAGGDNPQTVDRDGNHNLITAAESAGVEHFILVSIQGVAPNHPMELMRMKFQAEQELRASRLPWTIIRPTAFMETWMHIIGDPLMKTGKTRIFGRGRNPINFVSVSDVAQLVARAVDEPTLRGAIVEMGGPENLTMRQFVQVFQSATSRQGSVSAIPLPMMRIMAVVMRPINPTLARQIQAGVVMDTTDMTFDTTPFRQRFPDVPLTPLAEAVKRIYLPNA
jgi:uncharacterized protein YbjT (DUF2867 family)